MSTRTPYKAEPVTPVKSRSTMSDRRPSHASSSQYDYPESPTGRHRVLPTVSRDRELPFPLSRPKKRWGLPRAVKSPRRILGYLLGAALLLALVRLGLGESGGVKLSARRWSKLVSRWLRMSAGEGEGQCQFWSTMDAYHRDLARLRALYPPNSTAESRISAHHSHHHHLYSSTGHLLVSDRDDAPHPIPTLLGLGEKRWEELLARQSTTLEEAVLEYTRRYGRNPPKGFDVWWDYAMLHNLVLPDEYDRINLDLAPFFALPRHEMRRRMEMVEQMKETFTLIVKNGTVDIEILDPGGLQWGGTMPRAKGTAE